jgi:O-antigen/teichoic acid export membrane protein
MDLVLLSLLQGDVAAGWYGAAYKLWESIGLLPASLLDAMFPEMSRLSGDLDGLQSLRRFFRTGARTGLAAGLLITTAGVAGASLLISVVYGTGETYAPVVLPFRLLVCATPAMFLYLLGGHTLYTLGRQRQVTLAMLATGIVNVIVNLLVVPRWSYFGVAIVALLSNWLLWALLYPQAQRALTASGTERCPKTI